MPALPSAARPDAAADLAGRDTLLLDRRRDHGRDAVDLGDGLADLLDRVDDLTGVGLIEPMRWPMSSVARAGVTGGS